MRSSLFAGLVAVLPVALAACGASGGPSPDGGPPPPLDAGAADTADGSSADATDGSSGDAINEGPAACVSPQDCPRHLGNQVYCCVDRLCTEDVPDACADGGQQPIVASNYDLTCATDSDCTLIAEGNACSIVSPCPTAAISKTAYPKYQSDIANVPCYGLAGCPAELPPCCRGGTCQANALCIDF